MSANSIGVTYVVEKIRYRDSDTGYTIVEPKVLSYEGEEPKHREKHVYIGYFRSIFEGDEFHSTGCWVERDRYGPHLKLSHSEKLIPATKKGIKEFLVRHINGLGPSMAQKIIDKFGMNTISIIKEGHNELLEIKGIGEEKAKKIHREISQHSKFEKTSMYLFNGGCNYLEIAQIYEEFGLNTIARVKENPYSICKLNDISFSRADAFAKMEGFEYDSNIRIEQSILCFLEYDSESKGNLYTEMDYLEYHLDAYLDRFGCYQKGRALTPKLIRKAIDKLSLTKDIVLDIDESGNECVYLKILHGVELGIINKLRNMVEMDVSCPIGLPEDIEIAINKYEEETGFCLAKNQKEAVFTSLSNNISILTGGPGTGKTQTINAIINSAKSLNKSIDFLLCAPTGKASKRMSELTGLDANTIHSSINYNSFNQENEVIEIEADFVIIDEGSMVDAFVFNKLLSAIDIEKTKVLFVGDINQLPSVGAGLIFRDLIESNTIPTVELNEIFRQAKESRIISNAHAVINGKTTLDEDGIDITGKREDFYFIQNKSIEGIQELIVMSVNRLKEKGYRDSEIQILTPMRKGGLGVDSLNYLIQNILNKRQSNKLEIRVSERKTLRVGDRVIQTKNNPDLSIFNGEIGYITEMDNPNSINFTLTIDFGDKDVTVTKEDLVDLELAYALTIHKSQGSEFPVIIMPFHNTLDSMLTRNLVYTGITRAKDIVVSIGNIDSLNQSVFKVDNLKRNSNIKMKLNRHYRNNLKRA